jgi:hypothetical protein
LAQAVALPLLLLVVPQLLVALLPKKPPRKRKKKVSYVRHQTSEISSTTEPSH